MSGISIIENFVDNAKALVVFAHGAGADKSSDFMQKVTDKLNQYQYNVLRFNFYYMDKRLTDGKRYPPDRMPKLLQCYEEVLATVDTSLPVFLLGKSMGSRVGATLAEHNNFGIKGVICLGYPFHPQKKPDKLRLEPLQKTTVPTLIVQGDRDALGNESEIDSYELSSLCQCHFLPDGDHSLKPRVKSGFTHEQHLNTATKEIATFINEKSSVN